MQNNAIVVFTKLPKLGGGKTRLGTVYTPEEILEMQIAMMKDVRSACVSINADFYVYYYDQDEIPEECSENMEEPSEAERELSGNMQELMKEIFPKNWMFERQTGETVGERMAGTFDDLFRKGYQSCVMVFSDVPELRYYQIQDAFEKMVPDMFREEEPLDQAFGLTSAPEDKLADIVAGPSGTEYYLLGMTREVPGEVIKEITSVPVHEGENSLDHLKESVITSGLKLEFVDERQLIITAEDVEDFDIKMHDPKYGFLAYKFMGGVLCRRAGEDPDVLAGKAVPEKSEKNILRKILGGLCHGN